MNLHWGGTLFNGWMSHIKKKRNLNLTSPSYSSLFPTYNISEPEDGVHYSRLVVNGKTYFNDVLLRNKSVANISALHAENDFLKKTGMIRDMLGPITKSQSFTTVVIIASIFLFVTMAITSAVVIFCRKKNTVFAFQKSEQEDYPDYELEELNTDVEYTETDNESDTEAPSTSSRHQNTFQHSKGRPRSPDRRPLVDSNTRTQNEAGNGPIRGQQHSCQCHHGDNRGDYQMVVTAVLERQANELGTDESSSLMSQRSSVSTEKKFYGVTNMPPGMLHDSAMLNVPYGRPQINITYTDQPSTFSSSALPCDHQQSTATYQVMVTVDNQTRPAHGQDSSDLQHGVQYQKPCETKVKTVDSDPKAGLESQLYVNLPPLEKTLAKSLVSSEQFTACDPQQVYSGDLESYTQCSSQEKTDQFDPDIPGFPPKRSMSLKDGMCTFAMASSTTVTATGPCRSMSQPPTPLDEGLQFQTTMQMMAYAGCTSMESGQRSAVSSRTSLPSVSNFNVTAAERLYSRQHIDRVCSIKSLSRDQYNSLASLPSPYPTPVSDPPSLVPGSCHGNVNNSNSIEPTCFHDVDLSDSPTDEHSSFVDTECSISLH